MNRLFVENNHVASFGGDIVHDLLIDLPLFDLAWTSEICLVAARNHAESAIASFYIRKTDGVASFDSEKNFNRSIFFSGSGLTPVAPSLTVEVVM